MTLRHGVLTAAALAVLGLGVYLFIEVNATPATAGVARPEHVASEAPAPRPEQDEPPVAGRGRVDLNRRAVRRIQAARPVQPATAPETPKPAIPPEDLGKIDAIMAEANKAYDRGDFDEARQIALRVLGTDPTNVRMLRIVVSSACIDGDSVDAQKHWLLLPTADRRQMQTRCDRYGISFTES